MCNACGFQCCGSDQLAGCGCSCPASSDCAELCDGCGMDLDVHGCVCDDDEYPDEADT